MLLLEPSLVKEYPHAEMSRIVFAMSAATTPLYSQKPRPRVTSKMTCSMSSLLNNGITPARMRCSSPSVSIFIPKMLEDGEGGNSRLSGSTDTSTSPSLTVFVSMTEIGNHPDSSAQVLSEPAATILLRVAGHTERQLLDVNGSR